MKRIKVTEFYGGIGWKGPEVTEVIDEERFKQLYGEDSLRELLGKGHTGDCIGSDKGMWAEILRGFIW